MNGHYKKVSSVKKTFPNPVAKYEKAIDPERPTAAQRFQSDHPVLKKVAGKVSGAVGWMGERGREIQREGTGIPAARRTPMAGLPKDPYGMGVAGNPFGGSAFPHSSHPFNGPPGPIFNDQRPPKPTPARGGTTRTIYHNNGDVEVIRTGRSKPRRVASKEPGESFMNPDFANPGYIPKSMRHLF